MPVAWLLVVLVIAAGCTGRLSTSELAAGGEVAADYVQALASSDVEELERATGTSWPGLQLEAERERTFESTSVVGAKVVAIGSVTRSIPDAQGRGSEFAGLHEVVIELELSELATSAPVTRGCAVNVALYWTGDAWTVTGADLELR